jgi:RNase P subunit RPR2
MVAGKAEGWMGFACRKCGAPLAVQHVNDASTSSDLATRGWRVTCTGCGATEYYEPGTPMVRITISKGSTTT